LKRDLFNVQPIGSTFVNMSNAEFKARLDMISQQLSQETEKRQELEQLLDTSKLRELLVKDMATSKKKSSYAKASPSKQAIVPRKAPVAPTTTKLVFGATRRNMRTYRHKSEMVGDIVKAQKEYEDTKKKLHNSELELEELKRQAKVASAKASVAKIKIKALLVLMRKMIAYSVNSDSDGSKLLFESEAKNNSGGEDGVSRIIEAKLHNIATMIPQYNASLREARELAAQASAVTGDASGSGELLPQQQYDEVLQRLMRMEVGTNSASPSASSAYTPAPSNTSPASSYAPPTSSYAPPASSYAPPASSYAPPASGYQSSPMGFDDVSSKAPPSTEINEEDEWNSLIAKIQSEDMS